MKTINELVEEAIRAGNRAIEAEKSWREHEMQAAKAGATIETRTGARLWEEAKAAAIAERDAWKKAKAAAPDTLV